MKVELKKHLELSFAHSLVPLPLVGSSSPSRSPRLHISVSLTSGHTKRHCPALQVVQKNRRASLLQRKPRAALLANMFCAISGEPPSVPVLSIKSGHLYEKRLILKYLSENAGKDPITGEELDAERDLIDVKSGELASSGLLDGRMEEQEG